MRFKHGKKHFKQARAARVARSARAPRAVEAWHHEATFPENFDDPKWIFIPLVQTERAWAFGVPSSKPTNSNFLAMLFPNVNSQPLFPQGATESRQRCSCRVNLRASHFIRKKRSESQPHRNRDTMMPCFQGDNRIGKYMKIYFSTLPDPKSDNMFPTSLTARFALRPSMHAGDTTQNESRDFRRVCPHTHTQQ